MPKESVRSGNEFHLIVGWNKETQEMQVGVETADGKKFYFLENGQKEGPFDSLWYSFKTVEEVTEFQSYVRKAKRKAFGL